MLGKLLVNTNKRPLTLVPKGKTGLRRKVQTGTMVATSGDGAVATIALDPSDEFLAWITPADEAESPEAKFSFSADADLGEGVVTITGEYSCPIGGEAASIIDPVEGEDVPKS
jgi:hypothetical protein